ncbi:MAG: UDP-N-acetylmuramoyl-tripeptide--D-alanyl-D-alanine ligase [Bacteroidales bacterium]|nr:UDP-N-acetylmuramoyl-tripeptide--D-alanyl-D-alanine ligase [Bacteroidales bacterium]MBK7628473.1 UDP-N-acetylmuramoyl-tripeptide--D-alanyl-D-alanine ligase [Bacteroidales bacterium]
MKTDQLYELYKESTGIATDSRTVSKGQLFFALWGENYNGNKFAAEALEKGAICAVIDDPLFETENTILVDDCLNELQALATHHRKEMKVPVLAITGTNGKTTTKELIAAIVSKKKKVHYTRGNLNNHIGVPLTILSAPEDTQMMIIELGANHIGEIRTLCLIARPDFGIITNIGTAHIEGFGSFEGVVKAKTELYEYLRKVNGVALYNDTNPLLTEKIFKNVNRAVPFSDPTGIELGIEQVPSAINIEIKATYQHHTYNIKTNLFGSYNIENLKAAIATGLFFDVDIKDIVDAVENYQPANNRSQVTKTKNNTLICDAYNANPTSMHLALKAFSELAEDNKMVILGDMFELGEKSEEEHKKILEEVLAYKFTQSILVGPVFERVSAKSGIKSFLEKGKLIEYLKNEPVKGKTVLIKGSRGMGLEKIFDLL